MKSFLALLVCLLVFAQTKANDISEVFEISTDNINELKSDCFNTTGNDDAFDNFIRVKDVTQVCVSQFNLEKFAGDVGVSAALGVSKNLVKRYCPIFNTTTVCISNFLKSIKPCYVEDELEEINQFDNMVNEIFGFFCSNEGQNIADFVKSKGAECLFENSDSLEECSDKATDGVSFEDVEITYMECKAVVGVKKCAIAAMGGCAEAKASELIEQFFTSVYELSPCAFKQAPKETTIKNDDNSSPVTENVIADVNDNNI